MSPDHAAGTAGASGLPTTTTAAASPAPTQPDGLAGRIALVTGGGRGLGAAICDALAAAGAIVVAADLDLHAAQAVAARCACDGRAGNQALALDVGDPPSVSAAIDRVVADWGRLDVLVNNAAVDVTLPVDQLAVDDWDRIVRTNLRGPFLLSKRAFALMKRQRGGQIVNITSTAAKRAWPNASAYHATKWGLLGLSHALHAEGRAHGIKVTAIVCGGMRTRFLTDRFPDIDLQNLQDPRNVARAVAFALQQPPETVIAEMTILPMRETSWP